MSVKLVECVVEGRGHEVSVCSAYGMTALNGLGGGVGVSRIVPNDICDVQARSEVAEDSNILRRHAVPIGTHLPTFRWRYDAS
jgi:hypothetical protein